MLNVSNSSDMADELNETTRIINILNYFLYTLIVVFGVPGNVLVVWSLLLTRREQVNHSYKILVINLAITDIIMVIITSPFQIAELIAHTYYPFGHVMCSILWPLQTACYGAAVFNMVALNVHRYYVISYPTSSRSLGKVTMFAVALCWMIPSLITALPYAINLKYYPKDESCGETWSKYTSDVFTVYLLSVQYVLPLILIATLNLLTIRRLKRRYMFRLNTARLSADNLHAHKRIVKMLISIILIFALFGLPGQIMWLLPVITKIDNDSDYGSILSLVDIFNYMYCVLNPVLFFTFNNECYDRLKKLLAAVFFCCGYRWEISSQTGTRRDAASTLLPASRASDSQDTSGSDGPRIDPRYAPAIPKYLLEKHQSSTRDSKQHTVPTAIFSSITGLYTPVVDYHGNGVDKSGSSQVIKVAGDEEIFRGSFVELLRTRNLSNDLKKRLDESPETAIVEEGVPESDRNKCSSDCFTS